VPIGHVLHKASAPAVAHGSPLVVTNVCKSFGGLQVLHDVSLDCRPGEIVGLIGPNGAGKSTLINAITSLMPVSSGEVRLGGVRVSNTAPQFCAAAGLGRTFQNIRLFTRLTVRQNVEVALTSGLRDRPALSRYIDITALLDQFDLARFAEWKAGALSYGSQRRLEIVRALALAPEFLLLDEPAAGMNAAETTALIAAVRRASDEFRCGVLVIDHDLRFIMTLCSRIFVLDAGRIIAAGTPEEVTKDPRVIEVYIGHSKDRKDNQTKTTKQRKKEENNDCIP